MKGKYGPGVGVCDLFTLLFVGLKLTGYINWSWWWVLSPTWIPASVMLVCFLIVAAIIGIPSAIKEFEKVEDK